MGETLENIKDSLRRQMQQARRDVSPQEADRRSLAACARLAGLPWFAAARCLVVYTARDGEIDPVTVAAAAGKAGKLVYHPAEAAAEFVADDGGAGGPPLPPDGSDVLFVVPGLAFDPRGVRLGRGRGWYDRVLDRHPRGIRIGFAYDFQVCARLPEATWDVRMHAVVTDARLLLGEAGLPLRH